MRIEPKKILCAIDFSDFTNMILSYGKSLAEQFDSKLYICHVVPGAMMVSSHMATCIDYAGIEKEHILNARERLEKLADEFDIKCEFIIPAGHPADEIEQAALQNEVDLVIAATHGGSGVKRFLIGSVTNRLVKILSCPFLVLHSGENQLVSPVQDKIKLERILVGCDFSPDSSLALDYALSLAQEFQAQLYLANVVRPMEALTAADYINMQEGDFIGWTPAVYPDLPQKAADENGQRKASQIKSLEQKLSDIVPEECRYFCTPITLVLEGRPYQELIDYAEKNQIDMIVLGVRGHSLLEQFLVGSTTDRVISRASCPVLAVRQIT